MHFPSPGICCLLRMNFGGHSMVFVCLFSSLDGTWWVIGCVAVLPYLPNSGPSSAFCCSPSILCCAVHGGVQGLFRCRLSEATPTIICLHISLFIEHVLGHGILAPFSWPFGINSSSISPNLCLKHFACLLPHDLVAFAGRSSCHPSPYM